MSDIKWRAGLEAAQMEAHRDGKMIFMFFHHPSCGGCKKTLSNTFEDAQVAEFIEKNFVPVNFVVTMAQDVTARYGVEWTPTFILADGFGKELERWVGYLPPDEFLAQIHLSEGLSDFHREKFSSAEQSFEWILDHSPDSETAPEARYFMGVALYKETGDSAHLYRTWEAMSKRYPGNQWTIKASAWAS